MPLATDLSYIGVAKEGTKGTGVAPTAYIPITTIDPFDNQQYFEDRGLRGSMGDVYNEVLGPVWAEIGLAGDVFPDTFPWLLASMHGDVTTTGASAPFSHAMAVKNSADGQPGGMSITDFYGLSGGTPARRWAGCQTTELNLKSPAPGMLTWDAKLLGFASTLVSKPTAAFTAIPPVASWTGACTIAGTTKTFIENVEISMKRDNSEPIHTVDGTAAPYAIWVGGIDVVGKATLVHEDDTELGRYLTGTTASMVFNWTAGAGAALIQVQTTMSKCQYTSAKIVRGKQFAELEVDFKAVMNTTDVGASGGFSPNKWVCQNALPSGTYQ